MFDQIIYKDFPKQKLPMKAKGDQWGEDCVDKVISLCKAYADRRRSPRVHKVRNYNLMNNKINISDFDATLNPFGVSREQMTDFQLPATLQPYDVQSANFKLLFGEESKRVFNPIIRAVNESITSSKLLKKKEMITELLTQVLQEKLEGLPDSKQITQDQISKVLNYNPKDIRESVANNIYTYYRKYLDLDGKHQTGFQHGLLAAEELYDVDQIGNGPAVRVVNPLEIDYILPNNSPYIDDAEMISEETRLSLSSILDEFYPDLTPEQITKLEEDYMYHEMRNYGIAGLGGIPEVEDIASFGMNDYSKGIPVHRVRWKSFKRIGIWHYEDENGAEQELVVDEYFEIDKEDPTQWIEWFWISEYWGGIRLGSNIDGIYLKIKPRKNQFRSIDNLSTCKSGYIGTLYDSLNARSVSLMDRIVPWINLYFIIWYNTELLISSNPGKIGFIDISTLPEGVTPEQAMYYAKAFHLVFVNSYNEGKKAEMFGEVNHTTQSKELNLELGDSIKYNIQLLDVIEAKIEMTTGISRQRKGDITSSEQVGNSERAVVQSNNITEPYFIEHNKIKLRVARAVIEVAKDCMQGKSKAFQYITDDMAEVLFQVDGDEFNDADYGVFMTDNTRDQEAFQFIKNNIQAALQAEKIEFSQIVDMFISGSITDLKHKAKQVEEQRAQAEQQTQQMQQEMVQQQQQAVVEIEKAKLEMQKYISDSNNETKIRVAEMQTYIGQQELDLDNNGIPDPVEIANNAIKQQEIEGKFMIEQMALTQERDIKQKELSAKAAIEDKKLQSVKVQNASQEKLAKEKHDADMKMMAQKMKLEVMKTKAAIAKSKRPSSK